MVKLATPSASFALLSTQKSRGSDEAVDAQPRTFRFSPPTRPSATAEDVAPALAAAAALPERAARSDAWDQVAQAMGPKGPSLARPVRRALHTFLATHAGERLASLAEAIDQAAHPAQLAHLDRQLSEVLAFTRPGAAQEQGKALVQRLAERAQTVHETRKALAAQVAPAAIPVPAATPAPAGLAARRLSDTVLAPVLALGALPADKVRIRDLPEDVRRPLAVSPAAVSASYLVPQGGAKMTYRIGATTLNGGFSKIRPAVAEDGTSGKMRVLHLQPQRSGRKAKTRVKASALTDLTNEFAAIRASESALANQGLFYVQDDASPTPGIKLYMPMPDFGLDLFDISAAEGLQAERSAEARAAALRSFTRQVLDRLVPLHEAGLLHNDIKLENVMVDKDGKVELIDFGLARAYPVASNAGFRGTPGYMPPEQFSVTASTMTAKFDVWSLSTVVAAFAAPHVSSGLPTMRDLPEGPLARGTAHTVAYAAQQRQAADLTERWFHARYLTKNGKILVPKNAASEATREALGALNEVRRSLTKADPAFAELLFTHGLRADPEARYDAAEFRRALLALPPLTQDAASDAALGSQTLARAYATTLRGRERGRSGYVDRNDTAELAALPAQAPTAGAVTPASEAPVRDDADKL